MLGLIAILAECKLGLPKGHFCNFSPRKRWFATKGTFVVSTDHFKQELISQLRRAAEQGAPTVVVTSTDLCRSIRNANNFMEACYEVMQSEIKPGDVVLDQSSGNAMAIRYLLPRPG
jgi:hypothetical protein